MAQLKRSIEIAAPPGALHEQWLAWEQLPRNAAQAPTENVRWRAEVLTFRPIPGGTRIELEIEYDASGGEAGLAGRVDHLLRGFAAYAGVPEPERQRQPQPA
jgi:hypothetical protein